MEVDLPTFSQLMATFEKSIGNSGLSAADRHYLFKEFDPYVSIPPALLNAGHLASYAMATGMIEPFERTQLTKPATYLVKVEGECRYRDEHGNIVRFYLSKDPAANLTHQHVRDQVRLAPNSVCFITLAPEFRMPAYIGARFNLLIRDIYRGLLVGTGPLVDPGFTGRLSMPIHNFTNNEYFIDASEDLVYFEFTKLSWTNPAQHKQRPAWLPRPIDDQPPFPASKTSRRSLDDYINAATGSGPPASAIGETMSEMGQTMNQMREHVSRASRLVTYVTIAAAAGGIIAAIGVFLTAWSLYSSAQQFAASAQTELRQSHDKLAAEVRDIKDREKDLERSVQVTASTRKLPPPVTSKRSLPQKH